jgi:hypothetical protein
MVRAGRARWGCALIIYNLNHNPPVTPGRFTMKFAQDRPYAVAGGALASLSTTSWILASVTAVGTG